MPPNRRNLRIVVAIVSVLIAFIALLLFLGNESDRLEISVESPDQVTVGESFTITITVENQTNSDQTLQSIGIDHELVKNGFEVERIFPPFVAERDRDEWQEFQFNASILPPLQPNETLPIRITLVATEAGSYDGTLSIWLKNDFRGHFADISLTVVEN